MDLRIDFHIVELFSHEETNEAEITSKARTSRFNTFAFNFYFMRMGVLPAYVSVNHMCTLPMEVKRRH